MVHYYIITLPEADATWAGPIRWAGPFALNQARAAKAKTFRDDRFLIIKAQIVPYQPDEKRRGR